VTLNANGTFTYVPLSSNITAASDHFTYCANGKVTAGVCSSGLTATVSLGASALSGNPTAVAITYTAKTATYLKIPSPGVLSVDSDPSNLPLTVVTSPRLRCRARQAERSLWMPTEDLPLPYRDGNLLV